MMPLWGCFLLLAAGILAIYVEIFVPAGGIIGLAGAGLIIAGVVFAYIDHGPTNGTIMLFTSLVVTPIALILGLKLFPNTPVGKRLILGVPVGSDDPSGEPERDGEPSASAAVSEGDEGEAITVLRPSGTARIGGRKISVVTGGEYIEAGERLRVSKVEGNRVVVRRA